MSTGLFFFDKKLLNMGPIFCKKILNSSVASHICQEGQSERPFPIFAFFPYFPLFFPIFSSVSLFLAIFFAVRRGTLPPWPPVATPLILKHGRACFPDWRRVYFILQNSPKKWKKGFWGSSRTEYSPAVDLVSGWIEEAPLSASWKDHWIHGDSPHPPEEGKKNKETWSVVFISWKRFKYYGLICHYCHIFSLRHELCLGWGLKRKTWLMCFRIDSFYIYLFSDLV